MPGVQPIAVEPAGAENVDLGQISPLSGGGLLDKILDGTAGAPAVPAAPAPRVSDIDEGLEPASVTPAPATPAPATPAPVTPAPVTPASVAAPQPASVSLSADELGIPQEVLNPGSSAAVTPPPSIEEVEAERKADEIQSKLSDQKVRDAFIDVRSQLKNAKEQLKAVREQAKAHEAKAKELEAKVTNTAVQTVVGQESKVAELEGKVKEYEEKLGRYDLSLTDEFQTRYDKPVQSLLMRIGKRLVRADRDEAAASELTGKLLQANSAQLSELLVEEPPAVQGAVSILIDEAREILENRKIALDNWKASRAAVEEEQKRNGHSSLVKNILESTDEAVKALDAEGNFLFRRIPGNDNWNSAVDERVDAVRGLLYSNDPKLIAKFIADGVTAGDLRGMLAKLRVAYDQLKGEAQRVLGVVPSVGGATPPAQRPSAAAAPQTGDQVFDRLFGEGVAGI